VLARHILSRATALYSRDQHGIHTVAALFYKRHTAPAVVQGFDVAFLVPPQPPAVMPSLLLRRDTMRIGINISGLLAMGGYNRLNMFGLKTDYTIMIHALIDLLIRHTSAELVLIPHVSGTQQHAESDFVACSTIQSQINLPSYSRRICSIDTPCTHRQIKYLIGSCALFFGSRMHACIAALSQTVPAVGLAYSDKFQGVFDTLELGELVIDLRTSSLPQILQQTDSILAKREALQQHLVRTIPKIEHSLHTMMDGITLRSTDTEVNVKLL
jgi:polysaccharide pyruvyl transferase WcaK-like protein